MTSKKTLRIVFFSFGILEQGGGFENFLIHAAPMMKKMYKDISVEIVTFDDAMTHRLQSLLTLYFFKKHKKESVHRESGESITRSLQGVKYTKVASFSQLKEALKENDVVHSKNEILELVILQVLGYKKLPPVVIGIHTPIFYKNSTSLKSKIHNFIYRFYYNFILERIAGIYTQNNEEFEIIKDEFNIQTNHMLINQSMDLDTHHIIKNKTKDFNVLFLGRITEQKGVDTLLAAIEQISNNSLESCKFKFKIAGIGDEDIEKDIRDFVSIHRNVDYLGHVAHEKTGELYEWSDCVVVPSRYETLCKTAIEAGAYGKAVIVSDIPGPREVVLDGITGYLIKPNAKSFAASILSLASMKANDAKSFYSLGEKAQKYVIKKFSSSESYEKLYKIMSTAYMSRNSR